MKTHRQNNPCERCDLPETCFSSMEDASCEGVFNKIVQETIELKKNETLFRQQEKFKGLFSVKSGGVKTFLINESGEQRITGFYLPGEMLGFDAISDECYAESAMALIPSQLCRVPFNALLQLCTDNAHIQKELFKLFSYQIKESRQHFHSNAEQKVAAFLMNYSERLTYQGKDGNNFHLLPTQQDIASYLDLTPETVSRTFHKLIQEKMFISDKVKEIRDLDYARLKNLINA